MTDNIKLYNADCLQHMQTMPDKSVDLIVTDPPYFKVKACDWDNQWENDEAYKKWFFLLCEQWRRILKPCGSLYVFASPEKRHLVEDAMREYFSFLNLIFWDKQQHFGGHGRHNLEGLRSYLPAGEMLLFFEQFDSDSQAKNKNGFIFEPIRAYLNNEKTRAGFSTGQVAEQVQKITKSRTVTGLAGHWFDPVQWILPNKKWYSFLQELFNKNTAENKYLLKDYKELEQDYKELQLEFEQLRRPFFISKSVNWSTVWQFAPVHPYPGKHPCEKPLELIQHIIHASSRAGQVVFDPFTGSGTTGVAAKNTGRAFIGVELDRDYYNLAKLRISGHNAKDAAQHIIRKENRQQMALALGC